jgi:hypothetical protein
LEQERLDYTTVIDNNKVITSEYPVYESSISEIHDIISEYLTYNCIVDADKDTNFESGSIEFLQVIYP